MILWDFNIPPLPPTQVNNTFCACPLASLEVISKYYLPLSTQRNKSKSHLKSSISDHFLVYQQKQAYFLLSVLLWYLLIIETIIHTSVCKSGGDSQSHKATHKISSVLRNWGFYVLKKFPWHKLKLARVRNVCEVEINFDPKVMALTFGKPLQW